MVLTPGIIAGQLAAGLTPGYWEEHFDTGTVSSRWNNPGGYTLTDDGSNTYVTIDDNNYDLSFVETINIYGPWSRLRLRYRITSAPEDGSSGLLISITDKARTFSNKYAPSSSSNAYEYWRMAPQEPGDIEYLVNGTSTAQGLDSYGWQNLDVQYNISAANIGFTLATLGGGGNHLYVPQGGGMGETANITISVDSGVSADIDYIFLSLWPE